MAALLGCVDGIEFGPIKKLRVIVKRGVVMAAILAAGVMTGNT
jgi:hypothetical protein